MDERINKIWHHDAIEYSFMKRNAVMLHTAT
jgi:hypothetical protein